MTASPAPVSYPIIAVREPPRPLTMLIEAASHARATQPKTPMPDPDVTGEIVKARIQNPALSVPGAFKALNQLADCTRSADIPAVTHYLVQLRASQINGCSVCVDIHSRELEHAGEPSARIFAVAAWREAPYFNDAERAALALTEATTRLADHPDPVPDQIWDDAARHYDEPQLAALVMSIATINLWNRLNAATKQIGGDWVEQVIQPASQRS